MAKSHTHDEQTFLGIRVEAYEVAVGKSINVHLFGTPHDYLDDDDPVFTPEMRIEISGICIYPEARANDKYEITACGEKADRTEPKVRDVRARDKNDAPVYRKYRGQHLPVYTRPAGFAVLQKTHGTGEWCAYISVLPQTASEMLATLKESRSRPIYVSIHERKHDRRRWIQSLYVQTKNPATE
jgi:hypothetical protein